jgi:hypothetical protein
VSFEAVTKIVKWLKDLCTQPEFAELAMPKDLGEAMQLRLTAHTLGMNHYVEQIEARYIEGVANRVPTLQEVTLVVDNMRKVDDTLLIALANQLSYPCRYHQVSEAQELSYANLLSGEKYDRLLVAVREDKVIAMAKHV